MGVISPVFFIEKKGFMVFISFFSEDYKFVYIN